MKSTKKIVTIKPVIHKKSTMKNINISPKQKSFINRIKSNISEYLGYKQDKLNLDYKPSNKIINYVKDWFNNKELRYLLFIVPIIIIAFGCISNKQPINNNKKSIIQIWQNNNDFMKKYIHLFSLLLIPYLYFRKSDLQIRTGLISFFTNLKSNLSDIKRKSSKVGGNHLDDTNEQNIFEEDLEVINQLKDFNKDFKTKFRKYLIYGAIGLTSLFILSNKIQQELIPTTTTKYYRYGIEISNPEVSMYDHFISRKPLSKEGYTKVITTKVGDRIVGTETVREWYGGSESKFYTIFLGMIGFLDDSVKNFIIPLLSNTIDQIVSLLQDPKIDPKRVLMFFLVNTVLMIFGLVFNKIKRQIAIKNKQ